MKRTFGWRKVMRDCTEPMAQECVPKRRFCSISYNTNAAHVWERVTQRQMCNPFLKLDPRVHTGRVGKGIVELPYGFSIKSDLQDSIASLSAMVITDRKPPIRAFQAM